MYNWIILKLTHFKSTVLQYKIKIFLKKEKDILYKQWKFIIKTYTYITLCSLQ